MFLDRLFALSFLIRAHLRGELYLRGVFLFNDNFLVKKTKLKHDLIQFSLKTTLFIDRFFIFPGQKRKPLFKFICIRVT